uniref:Uncharacterized protein n=1 Tax=Varanus komodoensis TaxID=61221 RepID=A0A8D2JFG9_VARKO
PNSLFLVLFSLLMGLPVVEAMDTGDALALLLGAVLSCIGFCCFWRRFLNDQLFSIIISCTVCSVFNKIVLGGISEVLNEMMGHQEPNPDGCPLVFQCNLVNKLSSYRV